MPMGGGKGLGGYAADMGRENHTLHGFGRDMQEWIIRLHRLGSVDIDADTADFSAYYGLRQIFLTDDVSPGGVDNYDPVTHF